MADLPRHSTEQPLLSCVFQGTVLIGLAFFCLRTRSSGRRLLVAGALLALLALGQHFAPSRWLLSIPPLSLFRYPVKYLVGSGFCICIAAARGLDRLRAWTRTHHRSRREKALWLSVPVAILISGGALKGLLAMRPGSGLGVLWASGFALIAWAVIALVPRQRRAVTLGSLALAEVVIVAITFGSPVWMPVTQLERPSLLSSRLPHLELGRISVEVTNAQRDQVWPTSQSLILASRDAELPLRNVEDRIAIVEGYGPPEPFLYSLAALRAERGLFDLAGVTHYLRASPAPYPDLEVELASAQMPTVFRSHTALPRAYVARRARVATDDEAIHALADPAQPFRDMLLLAEGPVLSDETPCMTRPTATIDRLTPNSVSLTVDSCTSGYAVITDSFSPGWQAKVDGHEGKIERANLLVRAVRVAAGKHHVEMKYQPRSFEMGSLLSAISLLIAAGALSLRSTIPTTGSRSIF
jgi:hypothetical protein